MNILYQTKNARFTPKLQQTCEIELNKLNKILKITKQDKAVVKLSLRLNTDQVKVTIVLHILNHGSPISKTAKGNNFIAVIKSIVHDIKSELADSKNRMKHDRHDKKLSQAIFEDEIVTQEFIDILGDDKTSDLLASTDDLEDDVAEFDSLKTDEQI